VSKDPSIRREDLSPDEEKLGIEFYTTGKVDGGRDALRRVRSALESIHIPLEYEGYLPDGWKEAMTHVWKTLETLEEKYQDPSFITGKESQE